MEYVDGGDLYQKALETKKTNVLISEKEVWSIFIQCVIGLKALHELKIMHRDLKSANIFISAKGHVKIGDMNVSKVSDR
jgi:NIMA (never in mitosis gene a)-related kinase